MTSLATTRLVSLDPTHVDVPTFKFGGHRSYGNRGINSGINCYMNTTIEIDKLTSSIRHTERFSKSEIPIYNSEVPEKSR